MSRPPLILLAGPTATGKTELAIRLSETLIGEGIPAIVISADSRQVYRGLDIGTAKVAPADRARVPHAGLDLVDPPERFALSDFVRHATIVLDSVAAKGGVAILAGGTGLYLRAVARGIPLDDLPDDPSVRARLEADFARDGVGPLADRLRVEAPILAATTELANPRRVIRALEIAELRGDGPRPVPRGYDGPVTWLGLDVERQEHARWIAARAERQFADGLVEEAVALRERYDPTLPCFSAIGYHEAWSVADGSRTLAEAVADDAARNVAFAKRQRTWFRSEPDITWLDATTEDPLPRALARVRALAELRPPTPRPTER
ncbi:MAG: tRNA (adenosine(37)-N6)-dimethylallyltransferase MiaA [Candidatus Limnocylindrales bacterium]